MIRLRPAAARGHANYGWLDTWHSFSFADYHDPDEMGWGPLRVINDDVIEAGKGFGRHGHRDMEIISVVLEGALQHEDSLGNGTVIRPGEVQRMSAGKGVLHSEFNPSAEARARLLQIWIAPAVRGVSPSYEQIAIAPEELAGRWRLLASPDGQDGSVTLHQDARLWSTRLPVGAALAMALDPARLAYVHVARGEVRLNDQALVGGDGAKISGESKLDFVAVADSEILLFDLPATD